MSETDIYRDIFAEITAKALPLCEDPSDPEKITGYRLPVGPIHRAAGKLGFQMFDGEAQLKRAVERIEQLERLALHGQKMRPDLKDIMPTSEEIGKAIEAALGERK